MTVRTTGHGSSRAVLVVGVATAVAVLFGAQGCQRQSPRFSGSKAPTVSPAVTASVGPAGAQSVTLQMTDLLRFEPSTIVVHPGRITVTLDNAGGDPHQFEVPVLNVSTGNIPGHKSVQITFTIPKGVASYAFDCAYHTSEHMVGTLTVQGF